tara:strand:+ start:2108 stop:3334 length:1227 start_codon:yes stop_codon:yes gene_type:complete
MQNYILNEGYQNNSFLFDKAKGSRINIKNKSLIDLSMCAGSLLLGHNHPIFKKSIKKFLNKNISNLASPNIYAKKYSKNLKKIIPFSKIIFCNSGTEAVIKSLRLCKALSKRSKIAYVSGGWHGSTDQLLFKPDKYLKPIPISAGLSNEHLKNIVILPYNNIEKTKKILDKNRRKLSCVIVEPVQGSLPYEGVKKYLKLLENFTKKNSVYLIFDEMITGLRTDCSSAQKHFNIKPDISIFGKCFGAGLPIGFITISKKVSNKMSKLKQKVFFGGTYSGNSIVAYVANEVLQYILKHKEKIFKDLENKSALFENKLNKFFSSEKLDLKVYRFKSLIRLVYSKSHLKDRSSRDFFEKNKFSKIKRFKNYLKNQNIYLSASGLIFFSTAFSKSDLEYVIKKFEYGLIRYFK